MKCITDFPVGNYLKIETLNKNKKKLEKKQKSKILFFLKKHKPTTYSGSWVKDIVTNENTKIPFRMYQEEELFYWNDCHMYYFEKYDLKLNDEFIRYVLERS